MSRKASFKFLLLMAALLIFDARRADACSCGGSGTVLDAYDRAPVVVIAKAEGLNKGDMGYGGINSTRMVVEKVFKGNLKVGDIMLMGQGGGADCVWTFSEESIGREYLLYLFMPSKARRLWTTSTCGRSASLPYATDDLLYLNNMEKVRGKTRISGTIEFEKETQLSVEGRKIRITGANKTYEVKTDRNGVYEIYDLPPGQYLVEPEPPVGWKVDTFWLSYSPSYIGNAQEKAPKKLPILLQYKKHASLDIHFEIDNAIRGYVYDPDGKPMQGVCLQAVPAEIGEKSGFHLDCTNKDGSYEIREVPSGSYILIVNEDGKISGNEPFKMFYYPSATERNRATVINIGAGDFLESINVYVPEVEETITVEGLLLYEDGKPVDDESVQFKSVKTVDDMDTDARVTTDPEGRFSLKILKGTKGRLFGEMYTYAGEFLNCPKLEALIKKMGNDNGYVRTPAIEIQGDNNLYNVELKLPFPGCKKAKVPE